MQAATVLLVSVTRGMRSLQITIPMDERRQRRESQDMYNKFTIRDLSTNLTDVSVAAGIGNTVNNIRIYTDYFLWRVFRLLT